MNNENVIFKKSEMEEIVDSCSKTILSRFFSSNYEVIYVKDSDCIIGKREGEFFV